jgi:hypothetical protein
VAGQRETSWREETHAGSYTIEVDDDGYVASATVQLVSRHKQI